MHEHKAEQTVRQCMLQDKWQACNSGVQQHDRGLHAVNCAAAAVGKETAGRPDWTARLKHQLLGLLQLPQLRVMVFAAVIVCYSL
jgi:hypothetical protein